MAPVLAITRDYLRIVISLPRSRGETTRRNGNSFAISLAIGHPPFSILNSFNCLLMKYDISVPSFLSCISWGMGGKITSIIIFYIAYLLQFPRWFNEKNHRSFCLISYQAKWIQLNEIFIKILFFSFISSLIDIIIFVSIEK